MRFKFSRVLVFSVAFGCICLTSCAPLKVAEYKKVKPDVFLKVVNGQAEFVTNASQKCKSGNLNKKGCLAFESGEQAEISFKRQASNGWWFSALQICKLNPDDTQDCSLTLWERLEFAATDSSGQQLLVPDVQGNVLLTKLSNQLDEFVLIDQNSFPQDYYYKIQLCNDSGDCDWADPPLENKGRN